MADLAIPETDGVFTDVDEIAYHADHNSLSCSGAKELLRSPFKFNWQRTQPKAQKSYFDLGHYVHGKVLGIGQPVVIIDAPDFKTKAAREERDAAYAAGSVPVLAHVAEQGDAMAKNLLEHDTAGALFAHEERGVEVSAYWRDPATGVRLRSRFDLTAPVGDWLVVLDVKTTGESANPAAFGRIAASKGYYIQDAWYSEAAVATGMGRQIDFVFAVVETDPPHMVSLQRLSQRARELGRAKMRQAVNLFSECTANNHWPDYGSGIHDVDLPGWLYYQEEE